MIHQEYRIVEEAKENNTRDSNVVPHRSTNRARTCLTSQSRRDVVLSCWYGRSQGCSSQQEINTAVFQFPMKEKYIVAGHDLSIVGYYHKCARSIVRHMKHQCMTTSGKHQIGNELHPSARTTKNNCEPPSSVRSRYGTLRTADKPIVIFSPYAVPLQLFFSSFVNLAFPDRVLFFVSSRYCCRSRKEETTIFGVRVWVCLSTRRRQGQQSQISVVTT